MALDGDTTDWKMNKTCKIAMEKHVSQGLILLCLDKNSRIFFDRARAEGEIAFITYYSLHCTACKLFC